MSKNATTTENGIDKRDARALTEFITVLPDAPGLFEVVSQSGKSYTVDTREGACTCPDFQYRKIECKHQRRVAFATGERAIPAWADPGAIDEHLGAHVNGTPRVAATDGGTHLIEVGDGSENPDDERPDDCSCWDTEQGLPCWPCFREGFETPNPSAEEDE